MVCENCNGCFEDVWKRFVFQCMVTTSSVLQFNRIFSAFGFINFESLFLRVVLIWRIGSGSFYAVEMISFGRVGEFCFYIFEWMLVKVSQLEHFFRLKKVKSRMIVLYISSEWEGEIKPSIPIGHLCQNLHPPYNWLFVWHQYHK